MSRRDVEALIVGGGISGISASVRLRRDLGMKDIVLIEAGDRLGGTWAHNTYPGCACDIPSSLYSFEFAPNPEWSRTFAPQAEILDYVRRTAREHGVDDHALLNTTVTAARWHEPSQRWHVDTTGEDFSTPILIHGTGTLHEPQYPDVPGLDSFAGTQFHTSRWNHDHDLRGKRVALVGSGASAIQVMSRVQKQAARVTYLQRTPSWIWPKLDWRTLRIERALYRRFPATQRFVRGIGFAFGNGLIKVYMRARWARLLNGVGRGYLRLMVRDRALRAKLMPKHATGCKRLLLDNHYLPAITKPNVDVVAAGISEVRPGSVVTADGTEHHVDTIIWATGFQTISPPFAHRITGRDGRTLAEVWDGHPRAYMGASVPGFPNAFSLWGPNVGTGCNFVMVEAQMNYVVETVRLMRAQGAGSLDVRDPVVAAWKREQKEGFASSTWADGGCDSWYRDERGEIYAIYAGTMTDLLNQSRTVDAAWFDTTTPLELVLSGSPPTKAGEPT